MYIDKYSTDTGFVKQSKASFGFVAASLQGPNGKVPYISLCVFILYMHLFYFHSNDKI